MKFHLAFFKPHALPALACFAMAFLLTEGGLLQGVENLTLDVRVKFREWVGSTVPADELALIAVDDKSLHDFGRWPWPREVHGEFLQLVGQTKPRVVAWDFLFTEPSSDEKDDGYFAKGILLSGTSVVLGAARAEADEGVKPRSEGAGDARLAPLPRVEGNRSLVLSSAAMLLPIPKLAQIAAIGFVDAPPDPGGELRAVPLVVRIGDEVYPSLSLRALMEYWDAKPTEVLVRLGDAVVIETALARRRIPIDATGAYTINYRHSLEGLIRYGYSELTVDLKDRFLLNMPVPMAPLTGRILLAGQVADGLTDFGPTPLSPHTPLMLVHANALENILQEDYVRRVPSSLIWLGGLLIGVAGLARLSTRNLTDQALYSFGIPVAYTIAAAALWVSGSWLLPVVGPIVGFGTLQLFMVGRRVLAEQRAKEQIKGMFGTYVSPQLVNRMIASGEKPRLGGHEEDLTAYFSDIQGFSTFSEVLPADRLVELMNEYLTVCTDIVQEEGGTLDKYIGDAVVAMFGAPIALPDHAYRACVVSQRVQQELGGLREKWKSEDGKWPEVVWRMQSRIGLNSGACVVGNMGSRTRFNYTMMGDNVNLAARMESGAKSWGAYVMCTDATKHACETHGGDRVVFRPLARLVVMGRSHAVPVFEIVGLKESVAPSTGECVSVFTQGLERYYARDWAGAIGHFQRSAELEPNIPGKTLGVSTNPSRVYLEIATRFKSAPPTEPWDGVYVMKEK